MGNLFLINKSFELDGKEEKERDRLFINFCKSLDLAIEACDRVFGTDDLHTLQFSYGRLYYDLFFKNWDAINKVSSLKGISSTAHELFPYLIFAFPGYVKSIESRKSFLDSFYKEHFGFSGFEICGLSEPNVFCDSSWHLWKCHWLKANQDQIDWTNTEDSFLPNKRFSEKILNSEILTCGLQNKLQTHGGNIGLTFHEEIMKKKGPEIEAYTITMGGKILEANYYYYDHTLSVAERDAAGGSTRTIFKIRNAEGRLQYISLDHAHGMFEYHNESGEHLGEFKFDGSYNSAADPTHSLRTL